MTHLIEVEHHVHEQRLFLSRESQSALEVEFGVAAHKGNDNAKQSGAIVLFGEKLPGRTRQLVDDFAQSRLGIGVTARRARSFDRIAGR
jgi:hypothetical protein